MKLVEKVEKMNNIVSKSRFCDRILHRHRVRSFCRADSMRRPYTYDARKD